MFLFGDLVFIFFGVFFASLVKRERSAILCGRNNDGERFFVVVALKFRAIFCMYTSKRLLRYELFVLFETWTFVTNCVREYVDVVVFVSEFTNSLVPRTVLRA